MAQPHSWNAHCAFGSAPDSSRYILVSWRSIRNFMNPLYTILFAITTKFAQLPFFLGRHMAVPPNSRRRCAIHWITSLVRHGYDCRIFKANKIEMLENICNAKDIRNSSLLCIWQTEMIASLAFLGYGKWRNSLPVSNMVADLPLFRVTFLMEVSYKRVFHSFALLGYGKGLASTKIHRARTGRAMIEKIRLSILLLKRAKRAEREIRANVICAFHNYNQFRDIFLPVCKYGGSQSVS